MNNLVKGAIAAAVIFVAVTSPVAASESANISFQHPTQLFEVSSRTPEITGTKCTKVGTFRTARKVKYQCQKSSKGLRWAMTSSKNTANTSSTTTTTLAPIYLDSEITDVSKLLAAQECQIKDATFNTNDGSGTKSSGFPRPAQFPSSTGQLRVFVVPVNFNDLFFSSVDARSIEATYAKANSYFVAQ